MPNTETPSDACSTTAELRRINDWLQAMDGKHSLSPTRREKLARKMYDHVMGSVEPQRMLAGIEVFGGTNDEAGRKAQEQAWRRYYLRFLVVMTEVARQETVESLLELDQFRRTKQREAVCRNLAQLIFQYLSQIECPEYGSDGFEYLESSSEDWSAANALAARERLLKASRRLPWLAALLLTGVKVQLQFMEEPRETDARSDEELLRVSKEELEHALATRLACPRSKAYRDNLQRITDQREFGETFWRHFHRRTTAGRSPIETEPAHDRGDRE